MALFATVIGLSCMVNLVFFCMSVTVLLTGDCQVVHCNRNTMNLVIGAV